VKNLYASSSLRPTAAVPDLDSRTLEEFVTENKSRISTDHPLLKNAFNHLGSKYPQVVSFEELLDAASLGQGKNKRSQ